MVKTFSKLLLAASIAFMPLSAIAQSSSNCSNSDTPRLNSCKNNRYVGDESLFYMAKPANDRSRGGFEDSIDVQDNQRLIMRVTMHNNAKKRTAENVRVKITLPNGSVTSATSTATISSSNAGTVSDTVRLTNGKSFRVNYVQGSTRYYGVGEKMHNLGDGITGEGVRIPDGLKAGENRMGYLTFQLEIHEVEPKPAPVARPVKRDEAPRVTKVESQPTTTVRRVVERDEPAPRRTTREVEEAPKKTLPAESKPKRVATAQPVAAETKTIPAAAAPVVTVNQTQTQTQTQPAATPPSPAPAPAPIQTLPATGGALAGVMGSGALGYGLMTYRRSRTSLRQAVIEKSQIS